MTWFKVDDKFHDHPKARKAGKAAIGVWLLAGTWCADHLTDGFVPTHVLSRWGTRGDAKRLVDAGLWEAAELDGERGWRFLKWDRYQPTRAAKKEQRAVRAAAGRSGGLASGRARAKQDASTESEANVKQVASGLVEPLSLEPPTRPDPTLVSTSVSPVTLVPPALGLTDNEIERIKLRLGCDAAHAVRVASLILSKATGEVKDRFRYVQRAIDENDRAYRPTPSAGRASDHCPIHPGKPKPPHCGGCIADERAAG